MNRLHQVALELNEKIDELLGPDKLLGRAPQAAVDLLIWMAGFMIRLFEAAIADAEDSFFADKAKRRGMGWSAHDRSRTRGVVVSIGAVSLRDDTYRDLEGHQHSVLNEILGLTKAQRVDELSRNAARESAAFSSYRETAETVAGGAFSKTSVFNYVHSAQVPEIAPPAEKRVCEEICIHCDEDHVAEQRTHKGQPREHASMNLSIAVVTEGRRPVREDRYENIHAFRFVDLDTSKLQEQVVAYLYQTYDVEKIRHIYMIGDGASWIQTASILEEWFPGKIVQSFDKFHLVRDLGRLNKQFKGRTVSKRLRKAIQEKDLVKTNSILADLENAATTQTQKNRLEKSSSYYNNNFDAMAECLQPDAPTSCTEAMVSHVLSRRLSTLGGAFSRHNAENLGKLRAFLLNGGSLHRPEMLNKSGYYKKFLEALEDVSSVKDFSIFEPVHHYACAPGGTSRLLESAGQGGQLFGTRGQAAMA